MKFIAGSCTYCRRFTATVQDAYGKNVCPVEEEVTCLSVWEARMRQLFHTLEENSMGNDHGK